MRHVTDARGASVGLPDRVERVVSLVPSLTEWLVVAGVGERLVGVTDWCLEPADALAGLPRVRGTKNPDLAAIRRETPGDIGVFFFLDEAAEPLYFAPNLGGVLDAGLAIMAAINESERPVHPGDERIAGCRHVVFTAPGEDGPHSQRSATSIHPGWLDRSPCGTGTSAKLAQLHARGELRVGEEFVNRSVIGTRFGARIVGTTAVGGLPAVVPEISGRAWITGMSQYMLDPEDPFPAGFAL